MADQTPSLIAVKCAGCGQALNFPAKYAGRNVMCPQCGQAVTVPATPADAQGSVSAADPVGKLHSLWKGTISDLKVFAQGDPGLTYKPEKKAAHPASSADGAPAVGEYGFVEKIGEGGMGVVWRAEHKPLLREVAVKQVKSSDKAAEGAFLAEALVTGFLDHPNIVPVHALGKDAAGRLFLSMKLVRGVSWKKLLHPDTEEEQAKAAKYDQEGHIKILLSVCNAVAYAHSKGIIHRDLKPDNVMVGDYGEVLVMDWGIALDVREKPTAPQRTAHRSGVTTPAGTPSYMAPEMAEMAGERFGPWTDVYLLGSILHEILTGKAANAGESPQEAMINALMPKPRVFPPEIPQELAAICLKALAPSVGERYQNVTWFRDELEDYLKHRESLLITEKAKQEAAELALPSPLAGEGRVRGQEPSPLAGEGRARGHKPSSLAREGRAKGQALYSRYAKVVSRYEQALELWPGNELADEGLRTARLAYAQAALKSGDLGLAEAQLSRKEAKDTEEKQLHQRLQAARLAIRRKERSARITRRSLQGAAAAICIGSTIAFLWIRAERNQTEEQRRAAVAEKERADQKTQDAITAGEEAERQRAVAVLERERAEEKTREATKSRAAELAERERAQEKTREATKSRAAELAERKRALDALSQVDEAQGGLAQLRKVAKESLLAAYAETDKQRAAAEINLAQGQADLKKTAPTFFALAKSLFDEGKFDDAMERIGHAIQLDNANTDYRLLRSDILEAKNDFAEAAMECRRVLELRPGDETAKTKLLRREQLLAQRGGTPIPGLVCWWKGDGNALDSAGKNHGKLMKGAVFGEDEDRSSFHFNGSTAFVSVPDSPTWAFGKKDFTIALWSKFSDVSGRQQALLASDDGGGSQNKWIVFLCSNNPTLHFGGGAVRGIWFGSTNFTPHVGRWYHCAISRAGNTFRCAIDGVQVWSYIWSGEMPKASAPLTIGAAEGAFAFHGYLKDIRIYDRALSISEINAMIGSQQGPANNKPAASQKVRSKVGREPEF
ncbi:MAG: protein kinase [Planctomycetota bacterium]